MGLVMLWIEALDDGSPWATLPILALAVVFLCYAAFSIGWAVVR